MAAGTWEESGSAHIKKQTPNVIWSGPITHRPRMFSFCPYWPYALTSSSYLEYPDTLGGVSWVTFDYLGLCNPAQFVLWGISGRNVGI